jgi:hypothetical protein
MGHQETYTPGRERKLLAFVTTATLAGTALAGCDYHAPHTASRPSAEQDVPTRTHCISAALTPHKRILTARADTASETGPNLSGTQTELDTASAIRDGICEDRAPGSAAHIGSITCAVATEIVPYKEYTLLCHAQIMEPVAEESFSGTAGAHTSS